VPEIIDPATGDVLPQGSVGELVFSCITREGMPLLRYRTRDITSLNYEKCACGRTLVRMNKVQGRTDDMLIIRGVNVFPSQIEGVLLELGKTAPYYMIIVDRQGVLDTFEVHVEMLDEFFSDEVKQLEKLENEIRSKLQSILGISPKVKLVAPKSIPRSEGKAVRVIDKRKK
ncbi:MAG: phenylacetate--CoA ligase, partial [Clostridia bacterium]|nr:phenylacetate--CoA ligase [Clostridia bacterium]